KKKQIQALQELPNTPRLLSRATLRRLLYGAGSPYAAEESGLGTTSGVNKIMRADITAHHQRWFNPDNGEIVIVGDLDERDAEAALTDPLARWTSSGSRAPVVSVPARVASPGFYLIDRPGMEQAYLAVATVLDAPVSSANATN